MELEKEDIIRRLEELEKSKAFQTDLITSSRYEIKKDIKDHQAYIEKKKEDILGRRKRLLEIDVEIRAYKTLLSEKFEKTD